MKEMKTEQTIIGCISMQIVSWTSRKLLMRYST